MPDCWLVIKALRSHRISLEAFKKDEKIGMVEEYSVQRGYKFIDVYV